MREAVMFWRLLINDCAKTHMPFIGFESPMVNVDGSSRLCGDQGWTPPIIGIARPCWGQFGGSWGRFFRDGWFVSGIGFTHCSNLGSLCAL
ncbi:hypothetical protein BC938DRAFT_480147 [Jimgerdemannia flammicorona]|uniref:Uncharacterized protein n=1 Tax=Jimgerdemannia flammicorona TaxID=994334 RepID=A0A433QJ99_9FUNG|nr:hypothetical protein BC938DRAFT_480147 [Jimgerdemannia flammicorona]